MKLSNTDSRGLTLTELMIAIALASLVMMALTSFYFASQTTWLDGSTQALAQRDATLITEKLASWVQKAAVVTVDTSDPLHNTVFFNDAATNQIYEFKWNAADSLLDEGVSDPNLTACSNSKVTRFQLTVIGDSLVSLTALELKSADGRLVSTASTFALYNRP